MAAARCGAWPEGHWNARLSKLVRQPLLLAIVTTLQGAVQPVESATWRAAGTEKLTVFWPAQLSETVLAVGPPL